MEKFNPEKHRAEIRSIVEPVVEFYATLLRSLGVSDEDVTRCAGKVAERGHKGLRQANYLAETFEPMMKSFGEARQKDCE